jgi:hypothetical protein
LTEQKHSEKHTPSSPPTLSLIGAWLDPRSRFFLLVFGVSVRLRSPALLPARVLCGVHPCILCRATLLRILDLPRSLLPFVSLHIEVYFLVLLSILCTQFPSPLLTATFYHSPKVVVPYHEDEESTQSTWRETTDENEPSPPAATPHPGTRSQR